MEIITTISTVLCLVLATVAFFLFRQLKEKKEELQQLEEIRNKAETAIALLNQEIENQKNKLQDWEKTKEESFRIAKAAMFESGKDVFKQEAKELSEHFAKVQESVVTLHSQVTKHGSRVDTVWKSLSSPNEAGQFSEIGLENTLKNYGLESGRDFMMQYTTSDSETGNNLRPDAVVMLPGDNVLVIDSKASKFFLELASAEGFEQEDAIKEKLKKRMREHINSLASKGYKDSISGMYKKSPTSKKVNNIFTAMFIHSEASLEKLYKIDPEFRSRCEEKDIIPTGPTGLAGLLSLARLEINREKRNTEYDVIIDELSNLLGSIETVMGYALGVGKGIASAAKSYQKFTISFNSNLLPKARKMTDRGITLPKNKSLPGKLPSYHVSSSDDENVIEGVSQKIEESRKLEQVD